MIEIAGVLEALKWVVGISIGASIGSVIATKITFRQVESKFDIRLEDTADSIRTISETVEEWEKFRNSKEAKILINALIQKFLGGESDGG